MYEFCDDTIKVAIIHKKIEPNFFGYKQEI
jgi:hypothetical protein